jgi:NADH-quinone oxidoreductase subunit C
VSEVGATIEGACPGAVVAEHEGAGELTIEIARNELPGVARFLAGPPLAYVLLSDLTCADFPELPERFRLAYHLLSLENGSRLRLRVWAGSEPVVRTVTDVWATANWHEREVYDMFGVRFAGHPDLARILMPLDWEGHPLRRDYPLGGEEVQFTDAV